VKAAALCDESLLEMYVIDVGQGEGVLFKTPAGQWHLVDAGVANSEQMLLKGVSNFLHWKFVEEIGGTTAALESIILTHSDGDHYGGLEYVLTGRTFEADLSTGERTATQSFQVAVGTLYHAGLAKFSASPKLGASVAGTAAAFPQGDHGLPLAGEFITELLGDKASLQNPPRKLSGGYARFAALAGQVPGQVRRLSSLDGYLPGYGPGEDEVAIRVLGPVMEQFGGGAGLRVLDEDESRSKTVNGHSVVLRLDYGQARILLTGDLNEESQRLLLSYVPAGEFAADVAKSCHHGSDKVLPAFLKAMQPRATIISSGDDEDYSHPRPLLVGASGMYGRRSLAHDGTVQEPLVYSTELARSHTLRNTTGARHFPDAADRVHYQELATRDVQLVLERTESEKEKHANAQARWLAYCPAATKYVYGLVNVRTDGERILCATMLEKGSDFDIRVFRAGVDVPAP